jgi:pyruvate kinase
MAIRKTKIVCTLGPATEDPSVLLEMLRAGMNVARFNMAHGDHDSHAAMIARLREASRSSGIPVATLLDIKGPEIRTGVTAGGGAVDIITGSAVTVTTDDSPCTPSLVSITYKDLAEQITPGKHILIADGLIDLEVTAVEGGMTRCVVRSGGTLTSHKNVNVLGIRSTLPAVTEKDKINLGFGVEQDMDYVAGSFVRKPEDVLEIKQILRSHGSHMHVVAKIEDGEGLSNIDEIIRVSDGIMIARGDLGVQLATEEIPLVQKRIILKCHDQNKPVITATQMLDSMIVNPKPTRAEATDVANAIFDGTDAVMLSGETASGKYPVPAVRIMAKIALAAEDSPEYESRVRRFFRLEESEDDTAKAVARAAYLVARDIRAAAILAPTLRGGTPKLISKYRPSALVLAVTPSEIVQRKLLLYWGVVPLIGEIVEDSDAMLNNALQTALDKGYVKNFDRVVTIAGVPVHSPVMLNLIRVHFIGTVLNKGKRGFGGYCSGRIVKVIDALDAELKLKHDGSDILLVKFLTPDFLPLLKGCKGIIIEESSYLSREQIVSVEPAMVSIAEVPDALATLEDGLAITLHGVECVIYEGVLTKE